jgi:tRNA-2-methylthio-N6-dimethylallyladenosine synthase
MDMALIAAHGEEPKLMPCLHLPVQSGSDRILAAMNRGHTARDYLEIVERLRAVRPDMALSSDFIVGYPGESDDDFAATLMLVERVGYAHAFSFKYSPRPGTPAAGEPQLAEEAKTDRLLILQDVLESQRRAFNARCVGRTLPVLYERAGRHEGQLVGRTPYMQWIHTSAPESLLGCIAETRIVAAEPNSLAGAIGRHRSAGPATETRHTS